MTEIGYALSSEEHPPNELVENARRAEEAGFTFALISDHYHPWTDTQGQSAFVWSVLGAIARETQRLRVGTGVTAPIIRTHPAIIAQAAATVAAMMPRRFFLGVGTGENLNEHILGDRWPSASTRREMLVEALDVIRTLWKGQLTDYSGIHYTVENARIYTLPDEPPPVYVAASGPEAASMAGEVGDGLIGTSPKGDTVQRFREAGGSGKPLYGKLTVCWAETEDDAKRTAHKFWPNTALAGELGQELPLPRHFEQATQMVTEDDIAQTVICGPDAQRHVDAVREFADAGFTHVYVHQVGHDQQGLFRFYREQVLPQLRQADLAA
jgi:coenzyme F420-dependent glucose-6-phosphate dehydrogenase